MNGEVQIRKQTLLYILSGQDDFSLGESLEEIKRGIGDQSLLAVNTTLLEGQQVTLDQLRAVCETVPFLAERRLVIVKGLLERFEPKSRSGRNKTNKPAANPENAYQSWVSYLGKIPDSTIVVLVNGEVNNKSLLLKELVGKAELKSFPLLNKRKLPQWIQERVEKAGGSISPQAVGLLAGFVGSNLWVMQNEISKLVLFTSGHRIEEEDVRKVVSYTRQASVFAMVDAVLEFKAGLAEELLCRLLEAGATPAYLLVMLSRQIRMIVRVKALRNQGKSEMEIQHRLGLTLEFAFRKTLEQANRYPLARIKEVYRQLLEADLSIKTGKYGGELTLNMLIAGLCQRGQHN